MTAMNNTIPATEENPLVEQVIRRLAEVRGTGDSRAAEIGAVWDRFIFRLMASRNLDRPTAHRVIEIEMPGLHQAHIRAINGIEPGLP